MASLYTWPEPSPIRKIKLAKNAGGWWQVVIFAPEAADGKVTALPQYLTQKGFVTYLDEVDGENVIKVADLGKHPGPLFDALRSQGFIAGHDIRTDIPEDEVKLDPHEKLKKNGVRLSGAAGDIGHIASIVQGVQEKDHYLAASGALYFGSASLGAVFGNGKG